MQSSFENVKGHYKSILLLQAGLVELLYDKFRFTIMVCVIYFVLTTGVYIWTLSVRWKEPLKHNWSVGLYIMYIIQRFSKYYLKMS